MSFLANPRRGRGRGRGRGRRPQLVAQRRRRNGTPRNRAPLRIWQWSEVEEGRFRPANIPFQGVEAVNGRLPANPTALDYFKLYFTQTIIDHIVTETNRYADQFIEKERGNLRRYSIVKEWTPTDYNEMCSFLGLLMLMGLVYKPRVSLYWSQDELYNTPIFRCIMTRQRFFLLLKFLHFADNTGYDANDPNRDRLFKIRQICEMIMIDVELYTIHVKTCLLMNPLFCSKGDCSSNNT